MIKQRVDKGLSWVLILETQDVTSISNIRAMQHSCRGHRFQDVFLPGFLSREPEAVERILHYLRPCIYVDGKLIVRIHFLNN